MPHRWGPSPRWDTGSGPRDGRHLFLASGGRVEREEESVRPGTFLRAWSANEQGYAEAGPALRTLVVQSVARGECRQILAAVRDSVRADLNQGLPRIPPTRGAGAGRRSPRLAAASVWFPSPPPLREMTVSPQNRIWRCVIASRSTVFLKGRLRRRLGRCHLIRRGVAVTFRRPS